MSLPERPDSDQSPHALTDHVAGRLTALGLSTHEPWVWLATDGLIPPSPQGVPMLMGKQRPQAAGTPLRVIDAGPFPVPWSPEEFAQWPDYGFEMVGLAVPPPEREPPWPYLQFS